MQNKTPAEVDAKASPRVESPLQEPSWLLPLVDENSGSPDSGHQVTGMPCTNLARVSLSSQELFKAAAASSATCHGGPYLSFAASRRTIPPNAFAIRGSVVSPANRTKQVRHTQARLQGSPGSVTSGQQPAEEKKDV